MKNHPFLALAQILCLAALTGCAVAKHPDSAQPVAEQPDSMRPTVVAQASSEDSSPTPESGVVMARPGESRYERYWTIEQTLEREREQAQTGSSSRTSSMMVRPLVAIEVTVDLPLRYIPRLVRRVEIRNIPALHRAHPALEFARNLYTIDPERTEGFPSPPDNALGSSKTFLFQWRSIIWGSDLPHVTLPEDKTWLPSQDAAELLEGRADGEIWLFPSPEYSEEDVANLFPFQAEYFFEEEDWNNHPDLHSAWNAAPIPAGVLRYPFETNQPTRLRPFNERFDHTASLQATLPPGVFVRIGATMDPSAKKSTAAK